MILSRVVNKISGDKVLIGVASIIGLTILKNDIDQNDIEQNKINKINKLNLYKKPDIIVKSGIFDKKIKSISYSTFRFPFQRTLAFSPTYTPMVQDINVGNYKKRISYNVKLSDKYDLETLLKKLNINTFDDMNKLENLDDHIKEIVQTEIDKLQFDYELYKKDTTYKNELIRNINTSLSFYGCFIIDFVIGM
jgi:hypothetical protein